CLQIFFHLDKFSFSFFTFSGTFSMTLQCFFDGSNQLVLRRLKRFNVDDASFVFTCCPERVLLEHFRVLCQEIIRCICHCLLSFRCRLLSEQCQCDCHLIFPKWYACQYGTLNLFSKRLVDVLDHADLRCGLQCNLSGEFQIMQSFFQTVDVLHHIIDILHIHLITRLVCLFPQCRQDFCFNLLFFQFCSS